MMEVGIEVMHSKDGGRCHELRNAGSPRCWKRQGNGFSSQNLQKELVQLTPGLQPSENDFGLWSSKLRKLSPSLWQSVTEVIGANTAIFLKSVSKCTELRTSVQSLFQMSFPYRMFSLLQLMLVAPVSSCFPVPPTPLTEVGNKKGKKMDCGFWKGGAGHGALMLTQTLLFILIFSLFFSGQTNSKHSALRTLRRLIWEYG